MDKHSFKEKSTGDCIANRARAIGESSHDGRIYTSFTPDEFASVAVALHHALEYYRDAVTDRIVAGDIPATFAVDMHVMEHDFQDVLVRLAETVDIELTDLPLQCPRPSDEKVAMMKKMADDPILASLVMLTDILEGALGEGSEIKLSDLATMAEEDKVSEPVETGTVAAPSE